jgi:hypothetical protein
MKSNSKRLLALVGKTKANRRKGRLKTTLEKPKKIANSKRQFQRKQLTI